MYGKCLELRLRRAAAFASNAERRASSLLTKQGSRAGKPFGCRTITRVQATDRDSIALPGHFSCSFGGRRRQMKRQLRRRISCCHAGMVSLM
ncbi:hypothetical protein ACVIGB_009656 [Bradyrhizobium sp. USDA 4341]